METDCPRTRALEITAAECADDRDGSTPVCSADVTNKGAEDCRPWSLCRVGSRSRRAHRSSDSFLRTPRSNNTPCHRQIASVSDPRELQHHSRRTLSPSFPRFFFWYDTCSAFSFKPPFLLSYLETATRRNCVALFGSFSLCGLGQVIGCCN